VLHAGDPVLAAEPSPDLVQLTSFPAPSHGFPAASPRSTTEPLDALSSKASARASASAWLAAGNWPGPAGDRAERALRGRCHLLRGRSVGTRVRRLRPPGDRPLVHRIPRRDNDFVAQVGGGEPHLEIFSGFSPQVRVGGWVRPAGFFLKWNFFSVIQKS